jgi:hypothetical protein
MSEFHYEFCQTDNIVPSGAGASYSDLLQLPCEIAKAIWQRQHSNWA